MLRKPEFQDLFKGYYFHQGEQAMTTPQTPLTEQLIREGKSSMKASKKNISLHRGSQNNSLSDEYYNARGVKTSDHRNKKKSEIDVTIQHEKEEPKLAKQMDIMGTNNKKKKSSSFLEKSFFREAKQ